MHMLIVIEEVIMNTNIYLIGNAAIHKSPHYQLATIDDVVDYCRRKKILGVDTETEGFDFTCKKMIMFQIGDKDKQFVIDTRVISIEPLRDILENTKIIKIFHNAKFDYKFIKKWANITCEGVYDTYLAERVLNCGKDNIKYSLKDVSKKYLNVDLNKDVRNQFVGLTGQPFKNDQIVYGAKDVEYLVQIFEHQQSRIIKNKLNNVINLENEAVLAFADIEYNGLNLDKEKWLELEGINSSKAILLEQELDNLILTNESFKEFVCNYIQADLFISADELRKVNVKWSSPTQVLKVFKKVIPKLDNVNGKAMYKHRFKYKIIDTYIKYKEAMKLCTSYGESFFKNIGSDNKIHTNFHQILDTGRVSSSKPNMQQIPADNIYRNCFTAPDGWSYVSADYSSQELNVIAFGSKDPVWIKALENNEDLHSTCAELVYGELWYDAADKNCAYMKNKIKCNCKQPKKLRTKGKTIYFGRAYGMGPNKPADTLNISLDGA